MFCFVEQLCIPDCGEVAKKAEAEAVLKKLLASGMTADEIIAKLK